MKEFFEAVLCFSLGILGFAFLSYATNWVADAIRIAYH